MKINETPAVLVLHLKRFSFGGSLGKINKKIKFHEKIEVNSEIEKKSSKYHLFGLVVHHGNSVHSGKLKLNLRKIAKCRHWYQQIRRKTMCHLGKGRRDLFEHKSRHQ